MRTFKQKMEEAVEFCERRLTHLDSKDDLPYQLMHYHYKEKKVAKSVRMGVYSTMELVSEEDILTAPGYYLRHHPMSIYSVY